MKIKLSKSGDERVSIRVAKRITNTIDISRYGKIVHELYISQVAYDMVRSWFKGDFKGLSDIVKIEITNPMVKMISQESMDIQVGDDVNIRITL